MSLEQGTPVGTTLAGSVDWNAMADALANVKFDGGTAAQEPVRPFYARLDDDCPVDSVTFGEVTFHKQIDKHLPDGRLQSTPGQLLYLSDRQVDLLKQQLQCFALRLHWEILDGKRHLRGQTARQAKIWRYPGVYPNSSPVLGLDGKPLEKPELVPAPGYVPNRNDVPFTKWCHLLPLTKEALPIVELITGRSTVRQFQETQGPTSSEIIDASRADAGGIPMKAPQVVDVLRSAREFNEAEALKEQSLAAEAGIAKKKRGPGPTMSRED